MEYAHWLVVLLILAIGLYLILRWKILLPSTRRVLMGVAMILSVLYVIPVTAVNVERMTNVNFCLQCHSMEPYGRGLKLDDNEILSAVHYQNNYVPHQKACYTCHTDYTMFGPIKAKIGGLKHLWVHYTGQTPKKLKLYKPYDSKNCLVCHQGVKMQKVDQHKAEGRLAKVMTGEIGCNTKGCHDIAHAYDFEDASYVKDEYLPGGK